MGGPFFTKKDNQKYRSDVKRAQKCYDQMTSQLSLREERSDKYNEDHQPNDDNDDLVIKPRHKIEKQKQTAI